MKNKISTLALGLSLLLGCGGNPAGSFTGTWSASTTMIYNLSSSSGAGAQTQTVTGTTTDSIIAGKTSDIVFVDAAGKCNVPATVANDVATLQSGFACTQDVTLSDGSSATMSLTYTSGTVTLVQNVMNYNASGTANLVAAGQSYPGTFTYTQVMTRLSK